MKLEQHMWYRYDSAIDTELKQCADEGKDVSAFLDRAKEINIRQPLTEEEYNKVFSFIDELEAIPEPENPEYKEPSDLDGIHALQAPRRAAVPFDKETIEDKVHGAWIGRITGCLIGKPVEGAPRDFIKKIAVAGDNYPITRYLTMEVPNPENDPFFNDPNLKNRCFIEHVHGVSPSDDDTNYTTLALSILEQNGRDFTPNDVAAGWLSNFPAFALCTAEQAAFRNFLNHILPPRSGYVRNPYREWIGGQIRADFFGYINPGDPFTAADYAWRDACCTHTKNGIYGAMFIAAMIAEAAVSSDMRHIVETGLLVVPQTSRLKRDIDFVLSMYGEGRDYLSALDGIWDYYGGKISWVHTLPNAMIVAAALLWGENDYAKTLGYAIMGGMDTDCNGATVGSVIGMVTGAKKVPAHFTDPIGDTLRTDIVGNATVKVSDLARRTMRFIEA